MASATPRIHCAAADDEVRVLKRNILEMQEQLQRAIDEKTRLAAQLEGQRLEQIMQGRVGWAAPGGGACAGRGGAVGALMLA